MPSYIEIDQNLTFPSSSGAGKVVFGVNTAKQATITDNTGITTIVGDSRPYKVYTALLTQSGTSAPTATILENTLGGDIVWSYTSPGNYLGTLAGAFPVDKYFSPTPISGFDSSVNYGGTGDPYNVYRENNDSIQVIVQGGFNSSLNNSPIEIRVYN